MNEAGSIADVEKIRPLVDPNTQLMTCLALWNQQNPAEVVPQAIEKGIGLYGFTKPQKGSLLPPVSYYLEQPLDSLSGDDKNIGYLARVYNGIPF